MSRLSRAIGEYKRIFLEMEASPGEHTDRDESGVMHAHPRWLELYTASREVRMAMQAEALADPAFCQLTIHDALRRR